MTSATVCIYILFCIIQYSESKQRFVSDVSYGKKSSCLDSVKRVYTMPSEIQCIHRCMASEKCSTINYRHRGDTKGNCEVFIGGQCQGSEAAKSWKSVVMKESLLRKQKIFKSCKEVLLEHRDAVSGVYQLESGPHFCNMSEIPNCGGGGWTLAMKIDGTRDTFRVDSPYWSNDAVNNTELGIKSFFDEEAKFPAFSHISFDEICIGVMESKPTVNWLRVPQPKSSLLAIFNPGAYIATSFGRSAWIAWLNPGEIQSNCNREGFNVNKDDGVLVLRIGLIANTEDECLSPDSWIGIGLHRRGCGTYSKAASCFILIK